MNTSSLTGLVVVIAAAVWLGLFVPAWVKRGERAGFVRETTRQLKAQAKAMKPAGFGSRKVSRGSTGRVVATVPAGRVDYRALYQTALEVSGQVEGPAEVVEDRSWTPRYMPAPIHTGHIGTLEQPTLAQVTPLQPAAQVAPAAIENRPEESVTGTNLDEILRRRRAV